MENFIYNQYGGKLANLHTENIQFVDEFEATKMQFVCIFFHVC